MARQLSAQHPGAAASLREGLDETLTVKRLGLRGTLERSLSTTNGIENLIGQVRTLSKRVKRWRGGQMILRWTAAGVLEAERHFRRIRGYAELGTLRRALSQHDAEIACERTPDSAVVSRLSVNMPPLNFNNGRDIAPPSTRPSLQDPP